MKVDQIKIFGIIFAYNFYDLSENKIKFVWKCKTYASYHVQYMHNLNIQILNKSVKYKIWMVAVWTKISFTNSIKLSSYLFLAAAYPM